MGTYWTSVFARVLALGASAACFGTVEAATFVVTAFDDVSDGSCNGSHCSLREAIAAANAAAGSDSIHFAIAGVGPHLIQVMSPLPVINQPVVIDGYTQAGAVANTRTAEQGDNNAALKIVIANGGTVQNGLEFRTESVILRGVAIGGFSEQSVYFPPEAPDLAAEASVIQGCYLGVMPDGVTPILPMTKTSVQGLRPLRVGGSAPAQRNVIAGYTEYGIRSGSRYLIVEGNLIGVDALGVSNLVSGVNGVAVQLYSGFAVDFPELRIGGSGAGQRNRLMSRNNSVLGVACGVGLGCYDGLSILGNTFNIGIDGQPLVPPAQSLAVMQLLTSHAGRIRIGGRAPGEGNLIGAARHFGIHVGPWPTVVSQANVSIEGNQFAGLGFSPQFLPIRLTDTGSTNAVPLANDPADADIGPNGMQNKAVVSAVSWDETTVTVQYQVDSAPAHSAYPLSIEFVQRAGDGLRGNHAFDSYPEAVAQLTRTVVFPMRAGEILPMQVITTDADGGSSEVTPEVYGIGIFADGFEQSGS